MTCTAHCICGRQFDKYSGYLVNISDECISELNSSEIFHKIKDKYTVQNTTKHFVLCSVCLSKCLRRPIHFMDYKFKGGAWMTSNILHHLRCYDAKNGTHLYDKSLPEIIKLDSSGVLPFLKSDTKLLVKLINSWSHDSEFKS